MTAFARSQQQFETANLCWEIRSVNHRYLDVSFRLPETFRFLEPQLRNALKDTIYRGKLECQLKYQDNKSESHQLMVNASMVHALVDLSSRLANTHCIANDLGISQILSWPGVVQAAQCDIDDLTKQIVSLFHEAIQQLSGFRAQEGDSLHKHIDNRLHSLKDEIKRALFYVEKQTAAVKSKLFSRLHAVEIEVADGRVEQEIAFIIARMDVNEELDRLSTHCEEVTRALNSEHNAGRRLDFLMQELNREANTLSSKSDSSELTQCSIEMKLLIEQMREQIQNIE